MLQSFQILLKNNVFLIRDSESCVREWHHVLKDLGHRIFVFTQIKLIIMTSFDVSSFVCYSSLFYW